MSAVAIPAPTGGWNSRDSLAEMEITDCVSLVNLVPNADSVKCRPGYAAFSSSLSGAVQTLVTYRGTADLLLCAASGKIFNMTAGGAGTQLGTGYTSNKYQTTEFNDRIIFCNGSDTVKDFDGTTLNTTSFTSFAGRNLAMNGTFASDSGWTKGTGWTIAAGVASSSGAQTTTSWLSQSYPTLTEGATYQVVFTVSGYAAGTITPSSGTARSANGTYTETITLSVGGMLGFAANADFIGSIDNVTWKRAGSDCLKSCVTHKGRVYYVEDDTQSFWYAAAGAYAGTLTEYDLSQFTTTGGELLTLISWSRDGGSGVDDLLVCVFDTGELLVYAGSDPGSTTDWNLLGNFKIGAPLGRRCATKIGGDCIILTADGYVPLSAALQEGRYSEQSDFSFKIDKAAKEAAQAYDSNFGWESIHWPQASWFVVNVPISATQSVQHVRTTTKGAWCKLTDLNASCWAEYGGNLYFGSPDGYVYKMSGTSDAGAFIDYECVQAFSYMGNPHRKKQITAAQPITNFNYSRYLDSKIYADFDITDLTDYGTPPESAISEWDVGAWDVASWVSGTVQGTDPVRKNVVGTGYALAYVLRFRSKAQSATWWATHLWFNEIGIV